jgi:muramoyltetrapeptide carboxypeptidase LdcA involved in peptidoglycan recycling
MTVLSQLLGTQLLPDLDGHVLMLEEVAEAMYRIDRSLFHITATPKSGGCRESCLAAVAASLPMNRISE